jgi:N-acetylneuraminic acid mutarotase
VANAIIRVSASGLAPRTVSSKSDGTYLFTSLPAATYTVTITEPVGYAIPTPALGVTTVTVASGDEAIAFGFVLERIPIGEWGIRAPLLEANSEFALAESNGKIYVMGGYPASRVTTRSVQVYDIATDSWSFGPELPAPNNHGMAAAVNGRVYLIGGQLTADQEGYVNTVYEHDPAQGGWVVKAPMPTLRSGGVAVVLDGKIYVAGGRVPQGADFAVYDPALDEWDVLPAMPTQRNHITGVAINGRVHIVGGRLGNGLSPLKTTAHEVFDPVAGTWTAAAPMLSGRSGINGTMALGCFHVWGGEAPTGMTPQHEYYDPTTDQWRSLPNMPLPIHGVVGSAFVDDLIWVTGGGTQIGGSFGSLLNQTYRPEVSCEP